MLNWKVEEQILTKTKHEKKQYPYGVKITYDIENELTLEEKKMAIIGFSNGDVKYFISLNNKYIEDLKNGIIKKDKYGCAREVSKKAWIRKNDTLNKFWNGRTKENFWTKDYYRAEFFSYAEDWYFGYEITDDMIERAFNNLCKYLEKQEYKWFCEHDEYEILKTRFRECGCPRFGNHIASCSDGSISVCDGLEHENWKEGQRPITIDELKALIGQYERLKEYEAELSKEVHFEF